MDAELKSQRGRAYREKNKDAIRESNRKYREKNRDLYREACRKYREKDPEKYKEKIRAAFKKYREENRAQWLANKKRRTFLKRASSGCCTKEQLLARVEFYGGLCAYCGAKYEHIDHVIPVSRGGPAWPANLRPACGRCNRSKGSKTLAEWSAKVPN